MNQPHLLFEHTIGSKEIEIELGPGEYYVLGDFRPISYDSRAFGPVKRQNIIGKAIMRIPRFSL
jgi:signal peptidase I